MTPADQAKILALLDKIDPSICGPQTMREHAREVKSLLERAGFESGVVGTDVLEEIRDRLDRIEAALAEGATSEQLMEAAHLAMRLWANEDLFCACGCRQCEARWEAYVHRND